MSKPVSLLLYKCDHHCLELIVNYLVRNSILNSIWISNTCKLHVHVRICSPTVRVWGYLNPTRLTFELEPTLYMHAHVLTSCERSSKALTLSFVSLVAMELLSSVGHKAISDSLAVAILTLG